MSPHNATCQHERPHHQLTRMSVHHALVFILNVFLFRTVQERINLNDIRLDLLPVLAQQNAVACVFMTEQVKQWHDGYFVDLGRVEREHRREVDSGQGECVDFDEAIVCDPARKMIM